jgi:hypothetical protein
MAEEPSLPFSSQRTLQAYALDPAASLLGTSASIPDWGIARVPWLWGTRIKILFVIDGPRINEEHGASDFGLGQVIDTLRDNSFAWWVRFSVTVVDRDEPASFRFTQDGFDIDGFDQVWFFGDWPAFEANDPANGDEIIQKEEYAPLGEDELRIVAEWMERGGGVFATGDHSLLGASMCSRIPRVRRMRKWTRAQGVPSFADEDRHETLVHFSQTGLMGQEGDRWPQRILPVYRDRGPFFYQPFPHPLLCGRTGVIDHFPDHMHEGSVIEDEDVQLDDPLGIPGYNADEFPSAPAGLRPRPEVIAHGLTTSPDAQTKLFGLLGVYDGDPVGLGRVVVDSTWHHWFSTNLVGFQAEAPGFYARMQDYYRNVALWLSTPDQRASMLFAATWGVLVGVHPGAFDRVLGIWGLGERVLDVIGRTATQCIVAELVATVIVIRQFPTSQSPRPEKQRPARLQLPISRVSEAVVGGIALELVDLAHSHIVERARGRSSAIDPDAIRRRGLQGVMTGMRELAATLSESSIKVVAWSEKVHETLKGGKFDRLPISDEQIEDPTIVYPPDPPGATVDQKVRRKRRPSKDR